MPETSIEWCDHSINPLRARNRAAGMIGHHCEKVSPGCQRCYSSRFQPRFGLSEFAGPSRREDVECYLDESKLREVLSRKKPTKFFWCDMTDLFGEWVPDEHIDRCFAVMALTPRHTHMVLTKRPERMAGYIGRLAKSIAPLETAARSMGWTLKFRDTNTGREIALLPWPIPNVWLGTPVEDQQRADERIPHLLRTPAVVRFLPCEPLLGPVDLGLNDWSQEIENERNWGLQWVLCGGESGPGARPFDLEWARDIRNQCEYADVPFFFKQAGSAPADWTRGDPPNHESPELVQLRLRDRKGGDLSELPEDLRVRQFPEVRA